MIRLKLKPGREVSLARRHPWLFSGAVASAEGDGSDGHAEVFDAAGRALAHGSFSPDSQIVARLWTFDGRLPDASLFQQRFQTARRLRQAVDKKIAEASATELEKLGGALESVVKAERELLELTPRTAKNKAPSLRPNNEGRGFKLPEPIPCDQPAPSDSGQASG